MEVVSTLQVQRCRFLLPSPAKSLGGWRLLPALGAAAVLLKGILGDLLCQVVGVLERTLDVGNRKFLEDFVVVPEPMPFDMEVFRTTCEAVVGGQGKAALVIFECFGKDGLDLRRESNCLGNSLEHALEGSVSSPRCSCKADTTRLSVIYAIPQGRTRSTRSSKPQRRSFERLSADCCVSSASQYW